MSSEHADLVFNGILRKFSDPERHELPDSEQFPPDAEPQAQGKRRGIVPVLPEPLTKAKCPRCQEQVLQGMTTNDNKIYLHPVPVRGKWTWKLRNDGKLSQWTGASKDKGYLVHRCREAS